MDYFLYFQTPLALFKKVPGLKKLANDKSAIEEYKHIAEFGKNKYDMILQDSLNMHYNQGVEIHYIYKGKYTWEVEGKTYTLYPGDFFITCPWEKHGSPVGQLDLGVIAWLILVPAKFNETNGLELGAWSRLPEEEQKLLDIALKSKLSHHFKNEKIGMLFDELHDEINNKQFGQHVRVNAMLDEILVEITRTMMQTKEDVRDIPQLYLDLIVKVKEKPEYPWTVEEMAGMVNMRVTAFNEKMKLYTGYTPADYLIHLRLEKAKHLLLTSKDKVTEIAEYCGFYSVQHLSDTFKKRVGITPKDFRKQK